MNEQPEALRLADELAIQNQYDFYKVCEGAAAELRRLHAENTEIKTLNDDLFYQGLAVINEKQELLDAAVKAEREKVAAWMRSKSYATGHGDTTEDLLKELEWQVAEREREACAKVCEKMADNIYSNSHEDSQPMPHAVAKFCADAIRARGEA